MSLYKYPHFNNMRAIGQHAAKCLYDIKDIIKPGISTKSIDEFVVQYAKDNKLGCPQFMYANEALSDFPFPAHCCTSINEELVHGIPSEHRILEDGDLVKVDVTFTDADGWHGDSCLTFVVGGHPDKLVTVAYEAMMKGIEAVKVGQPISDIGKAIEDYVKERDYSVLRDFCGHSIGKQFHLPPSIPHYYFPEHEDSGTLFKPGMMFTIEPSICEGEDFYHVGGDNWVIETADGGWSAQFEHTLGIDEDGKVIIFTLL